MENRGRAIRLPRLASFVALQRCRAGANWHLGAINIPFYEEMARKIHWWQYSGCRILSFTPYYIIVGEFGIAVVLAMLARTLRGGSWRAAILGGIAGGAAIFVCYFVAFGLTDGLWRR